MVSVDVIFIILIQMNTKNKLMKPKSSTRLPGSPEPHLKSPLPLSNVYTVHDTPPAPLTKARPQPNKKPQNTKEPLVPKSKPIQQAQLQSNSDSELDGSEIQKQELLQLEIKHLKRQNTFLKKKLQELTAQQETYYPKKKIAPKNKGYQAPNIESLHLNVKYFFKEINNLLSSITKLFKLNLNEQDNPFNSRQIQIEKQQCPLQREFIFKKYLLNRKLEQIALIDQEKKYPTLLEIFTEYYKYKEEAEKKILENLDNMIVKTNELNKWLLEKAQIKKLKSQVYSINKDLVNTPEKGFTYQFLKMPDNNTNRMTFSPGTKHTQTYRRNTDMSP